MKVSPPRKFDNAHASGQALFDDPKLLGRRPAPPSLRSSENRNRHYAHPLTCQLTGARSHNGWQPGRRGWPDAYSVALDLTFLRMTRGNAGRNVKSATLGDSNL